MIEAAPAKINLCLHVTGRRGDGYHLLDSIVVFAEVGDLIAAEPAAGLSLRIDGPEADGLTEGADNLVLRAARAFGGGLGAALTLTKHLPVASGIGGGSADAAASLRLLARLWGLALPGPEAVLALGADVPVCLLGQPARMRGIGDIVTPLVALPEVHLVLVNPRVAVSTPAVFKALPNPANPGLPDLPAFADAAGLARWLSAQRNDLEAPARARAPEIARVKAALAAQPGCLLARMSGSGATCFGLFARSTDAAAARDAIRAAERDWWVAAGQMRS